MLNKYYYLMFFPALLLLGSCEDFRYEAYEPHTTEVYYAPAEPFVIYSPIYKQQFKPGYDLIIKWDSHSKIQSVNIELYKASTFQLKLAESINNSGNFSWLIPADMKASVKYNIKISNADNENEFIFSDHFGIYE